jgi:hypothetical protein
MNAGVHDGRRAPVNEAKHRSSWQMKEQTQRGRRTARPGSRKSNTFARSVGSGNRTRATHLLCGCRAPHRALASLALDAFYLVVDVANNLCFGEPVDDRVFALYDVNCKAAQRGSALEERWRRADRRRTTLDLSGAEVSRRHTGRVETHAFIVVEGHLTRRHVSRFLLLHSAPARETSGERARTLRLSAGVYMIVMLSFLFPTRTRYQNASHIQKQSSAWDVSGSADAAHPRSSSP